MFLDIIVRSTKIIKELSLIIIEYNIPCCEICGKLMKSDGICIQCLLNTGPDYCCLYCNNSNKNIVIEWIGIVTNESIFIVSLCLKCIVNKNGIIKSSYSQYKKCEICKENASVMLTNAMILCWCCYAEIASSDYITIYNNHIPSNFLSKNINKYEYI
jgi:hypothetical protein